MKQVCYITTHVHTSVCMNAGTCVCMRRVSVLLCVGACENAWYDMTWCMWERMHAPHTTLHILHQGQFFCDTLLCSIKFHTTLHHNPICPYLLPNFLWWYDVCENACICDPKTHAWATLQNAYVSDPVTETPPQPTDLAPAAPTTYQQASSPRDRIRPRHQRKPRRKPSQASVWPLCWSSRCRTCQGLKKQDPTKVYSQARTRRKAPSSIQSNSHKKIQHPTPLTTPPKPPPATNTKSQHFLPLVTQQWLATGSLWIPQSKVYQNLRSDHTLKT